MLGIDSSPTGVHVFISLEMARLDTGLLGFAATVDTGDHALIESGWFRCFKSEAFPCQLRVQA
jgi:hypothetical protein